MHTYEKVDVVWYLPGPTAQFTVFYFSVFCLVATPEKGAVGILFLSHLGSGSCVGGINAMMVPPDRTAHEYSARLRFPP